MDSFEAKKRELFGPIFIEAGAGLLDCQGFEFGVALLLYHFSRMGVSGLEPDHLEMILEDKEKRTAGQLIRMLKKHCDASPHIEEQLEAALAARNRLVHRVLIDNAEKLVEEQARNELLKEIRSLRRAIRAGDQALQPFIVYLGKELDGLDCDDFEREVRQKLS